MNPLPHAKSDEQAKPPAVDISSEAVSAQAKALSCGASIRSFPEIGAMLEALAADRDRLDKERDASVWAELRAHDARADAETERDRYRTFIRSARRIVQAYASEHPTHVWGRYTQDPMGAHGWLAREAAEIGTMRDGGNPKVERT